ncbi:MAG: F0F1 ATP synthase subunit B [Saprospiraceae bacterium]|nr:F0F1 ATP synthase subunit B [Saprospiraceae bacterium]
MAHMLILADFSVMKPDPGLVFWTFLIFLLVWGILGRAAFRPIQNALKKREQDIQNSLDEAKKAREDMSQLQAQNEQLLKQAQEERTKILKEAKDTKESIIKEAKEEAKGEAQKIVADAKAQINNMRMEALTNIRNEVGTMAVDIAEKMMRAKLEGDKEQEALVAKLVEEIKFN